MLLIVNINWWRVYTASWKPPLKKRRKPLNRALIDTWQRQDCTTDLYIGSKSGRSLSSSLLRLLVVRSLFVATCKISIICRVQLRRLGLLPINVTVQLPCTAPYGTMPLYGNSIPTYTAPLYRECIPSHTTPHRCVGNAYPHTPHTQKRTHAYYHKKNFNTRPPALGYLILYSDQLICCALALIE